MDVTFTPVELVLRERDGEAVWEIKESFGGLIVSDNHNNTTSETDAAANEETGGLNVTNDSSDSIEHSESHRERSVASLLPQEKPDDSPSLGMLGRLPQEIRDYIWDLCYQEKEYEICLCDELSPGTVNFCVNALLPQLRLISKQCTFEYNQRCPAKAVLTRGGLMHRHYDFKLDQGYTKEGTTSRPTDFYLRKHSRQSDKKILLFEIAGIQTHDFTTDDFTENTHWLKNSNVAAPPEGSFTASLRFYDDLETNRTEFNRVFGGFRISFKQESEYWGMVRQPGSVEWEYKQLAEVTVHSGELKLNKKCKHLPTIGKWTPQDSFEFNGTPHGLIDPRTGDLKVVEE